MGITNSFRKIIVRINVMVDFSYITLIPKIQNSPITYLASCQVIDPL